MTDSIRSIEPMFAVAALIAPLFVIIALSAVAQKKFVLPPKTASVFNSFALNVGLPALLFHAIATTPFVWQHASQLIIVNSLYFVSIFVGTLLLGTVLRISKPLLRTLVICLGLGNVAYLGIPVLQLAYGDQALADAGVIVAVYLFWVFTLGIAFLEWSTHTKHHLGSVEWSLHRFQPTIIKDFFLALLKNPILIAVLAGSAVSVLSIPVPTILMEAIAMVARSVTPIVLIVIGLFIGTSQLGKWRDWLPVVGFSSLVLIFFPLLFYLVLDLVTGTPQAFATSIMSAAMPLAITPFALADKYKLDKIFISRAIVLSTIASMVTIPVWIFYLQ